jgi:hypothetical protein
MNQYEGEKNLFLGLFACCCHVVVLEAAKMKMNSRGNVFRDDIFQHFVCENIFA